MKIEADNEGRQVITQLCDVALKAGGLQNLQAITAVLNEINKQADRTKEKIDVPSSVKERLEKENK